MTNSRSEVDLTSKKAVVVRVEDIKEGDAFVPYWRRDAPRDSLLPKDEVRWVALENAERLSDCISVRVQFWPDGGISTRVWDLDSDFVLTVLR